MLRRFGVVLPEPPKKDTDLLSWVEKCILDNTLKKQKKPCGPSCFKNIIKGLGLLTVNRIFKREKPDHAIKHAEQCAKCEFRTFLDVKKWAINVVFTDGLPINHTPGDWDALWCSVCKCCIEAKILVEDEKCPMGLWKIAEAEAEAETEPPTPGGDQ